MTAVSGLMPFTRSCLKMASANFRSSLSFRCTASAAAAPRSTCQHGGRVRSAGLCAGEPLLPHPLTVALSWPRLRL